MSSEDRDISSLQSEVEAARRTIAVLKRKVWSLNDGCETSIRRQLDAAKRREEEGRRRREAVEARTEHFRCYSAELEAEVARRTLALRRITDNVPVGLLVVDESLRVQPEFTRSCRRLLGSSRIEETPLTELLRMDGDDAVAYRLSVAQVFEDMLPEALSLGQLRTDFHIDWRMVRAEPCVLRNPAGKVEGLLYTLTEITPLLEAQREASQNRMLIGILRSKVSFRMFLEETRSLLARADAALTKGDTAAAVRAVHTIKGNSATYQLDEIVMLIHEIEERGVDLAAVASIQAAFAHLLHEHEAVLGITFDGGGRSGFELSFEQVQMLRRTAEDLGSEELSSILATFGRRTARELLGPIEASVARLAERFDKEIAFFSVGLDTPLDEERMRPILQSVPHLLRNAVDHGIEPPERRAPKDRKGTIGLIVEWRREHVRITLTDDGAGIDRKRVVERAVERGYVTVAQVGAMSEAAQLDLILMDGITTAADATLVSGRGIGMSAVRAAVKDAGGTIRIDSRAGGGTAFVIEIPHQEADLVRAEKWRARKAPVGVSLTQPIYVRAATPEPLLIDTSSSSLSRATNPRR